MRLKATLVLQPLPDNDDPIWALGHEVVALVAEYIEYLARRKL